VLRLVPRLTIRRLMALVVVVAFVIYCVQLGRWRRYALDQANNHAESAAMLRALAQGNVQLADRSSLGREDPTSSPLRTMYLERAQSNIAQADRNEVAMRKWERAARYPWLPVAPDLPEPTDEVRR
jgi:hypothetical protein